jgi:hypothetical protein
MLASGLASLLPPLASLSFTSSEALLQVCHDTGTQRAEEKDGNNTLEVHAPAAN